ncbi:MAG: TolC family protein [Alistipes sp.]|nr:TolC family protein [Alistipes sp.]
MRPTVLFILSALIYVQALGQCTLSLTEAAEMTFATNSKIKATEFQALAAKRSRQAALSLFSPQINIHSGWVHAQKDLYIDINPLKPLLGSLDIAPLLGLDWRYTIQNRNFGFIEADITVPIFTGGKIISAVKAAKTSEQIAISQGLAQRQATFTELVERYFALSLSRSAVAVRTQVLEGMQQHLKDISALESLGMATKAEVLYVKYRLSEAEQELAAATSTLNLAHTALCTTIGTESIGELTTPIFYIQAIESLDHFITLALQSNAQLSEVRSQRQLAKQNIAVHRAEFFPEIVAMGGGGFTRNVTNILPRWAVGVGLNFKLFDGLRREYQYSAAKNTYKRVEALELATQDDIKLLVTSLYNSTTASLERILALQSSIDFATEYLQMQRDAFAEGAATSTTVIDATIELAAVRIEQLKCAFEFDTNLAKLLEAAGASDTLFDYSNSSTKHSLSYEKE